MRRRTRSNLVAVAGVLIGSATVWSLAAETSQEAALTAGRVVEAPATPPFGTATRPPAPRPTPSSSAPVTPSGTPSGTPAPSTSSAPPEPAPPQARLVAVDRPDPESDIVVDGDGHLLYRYAQDTADPPASNCLGTCTATWAPLLTTGQPAVTGIDSKLVSTLRRPEGTTQVTLGGWPLYRLTTEDPEKITTQGNDRTFTKITPGTT